MTDTTEPWQPLPGTGPAGKAETPLPGFPLPADQIVTPPAVSRPRRRGGLVAIAALAIVGLACALGSGALLVKELTRKATKAEQTAALAKEIASRWQRLPAGKIFPATVSYTSGDGAALTATRAGIGPQTSCQSALGPRAFEQIRPFGCAAMLRATYLDGTGRQAVTVGIAVFPSAAAAQEAQGALEASVVAGELNVMPITGTIADTFSNSERANGDAQLVGPYVLLYAAGFTDGMPGSVVASDQQLTALGTGVVGALEPNLTKHGKPCTMKDITC